MSFVWRGKTLKQIRPNDWLAIIRDGRGHELVAAMAKDRTAQLKKLQEEP